VRLWTLHPKYLDSVGIVALWRESLLAKAVLLGKTKGYKHHPQLIRFQKAPNPVGAIEMYLHGIYEEALARGYAFDPRKLARRRTIAKIAETRGQVAAEWEHLMRKLKKRSPAKYREVVGVERRGVHPLFRVVAGGVREWEKSGE
jgi:hypothetical protein